MPAVQLHCGFWQKLQSNAGQDRTMPPSAGPEVRGCLSGRASVSPALNHGPKDPISVAFAALRWPQEHTIA